jgi:hypothetical protein
MAYDRKNGAPQARVLSRFLADADTPRGLIAKLSGLDESRLNDWTANRQPIPAWALVPLAQAFDEAVRGRGLVFLVAATDGLAGLGAAFPARQRNGCVSEASRRLMETAARFNERFVEALTDPRSPGVVDVAEQRDLADTARLVDTAAHAVVNAAPDGAPQLALMAEVA